jgi:GDP-L-fucose synthase
MVKILVTGGDGLVGNAIKSIAGEFPDFQCVFATRKDADLTDRIATEKMFKKHNPDYVIHTAARVGGIGRNLNSPVLQFTDNILMNTNVIDCAHKHGVKRLIAFSSVCVFPADAPVIKEDILQNGPPFPAHMTYAYAKRMTDIHIQSYKLQFGDEVDYCSVIPGNIFGEHDNYSLEDGHVIPSLLHKSYLAKKSNNDLVVWGDGSSTREFVYAKDVARICLMLLRSENKMPLRLIVSGEQEYSIKEISKIICEVAGHDKIAFDASKPNGQKKRPADHSLFRGIFPDFKFSDIKDSLRDSYLWFEKNYNETRK